MLKSKSLPEFIIKLMLIIGMAPVAVTMVLSAGPMGLFVVFVLVCIFVPSVRAKVFSGTGGLIGGLFRGLLFLPKLVFWNIPAGIIKALVWMSSPKVTPGRFMGWGERGRMLSPGNKGLLVDGQHSRLSDTVSYESILIQGGMGRGKTSTFVIPNLLNPPRDHPSMVISDLSGELFLKCSGRLERLGYDVKVLNLMHPGESETYNPLANAKTPQAIADVTKGLIAANAARNPGGSQDPFWEQSAEKLIRILTQCLVNKAATDPAFADKVNLANVRHLVTGFDSHTAPKGKLGKIDQFVLDATKSDPQTFQSYQSFINGNLKTIQSVLMSADVALDGVGTPEMAALTANSSIDFADLRTRKAAIFIVVNQMQMSDYAFLLNLFYAELFSALLRNASHPGRPVYLFLDEFGHLAVPNFPVFATTARKYKVSMSLFVQSLSQLEAQYGRQHLTTIRDGLGTEIYLPGTSLDTARELEARLGSRINVPNGHASGGKAPLMSATNIIRMKEGQALMLYSNKLPIKLKTKPYFKTAATNHTQYFPASLPTLPLGYPPLVSL